MQRFGDPSFDLFKLSDEHNELRAVLRDLCEKEIAPYAADVDENSRFPEESLKVLNATGFSAVHVPEEYSGQGSAPGNRPSPGMQKDPEVSWELSPATYPPEARNAAQT